MEIFRVKSIRKIGIKQTYNLKMKEPYHNYVLGNGLISANSHSTAYAHLTYTTAWLKYYYPVEFFTALLTWENDSERIGAYIASAIANGIKVSPPDINLSKSTFYTDGKSILFGFSELKGLGESTAEEIIKSQPYKDIVDFLIKVDTRKVTRKHLEVLAKVGAFQSLCSSRKFVAEEISRLRDIVDDMKKKKTEIQEKTIDLDNINNEIDRETDPKKIKKLNTKKNRIIRMVNSRKEKIKEGKRKLLEWRELAKKQDLPDYEQEEIISIERELMGFNVSLDEYDLECKGIDGSKTTIRKYMYDLGVVDSFTLSMEANKTKHLVGGVITKFASPIVKKEGFWKGKRLGIIHLRDISGTGRIEVFVAPDKYESLPRDLKEGDIILVRGTKVGDQIKVSSYYKGKIKRIRKAI